MSVSFLQIKARSLRLTSLFVAVFVGATLAWLSGSAVGAAQAAPFSDVPASHPYHVQVETLAQLGIIDGYSDGTFRPAAPVTRQQFAKMVILAMRISVGEDDECTFTDVDKSTDISLYPDNYIAAAQRENIVTGYSSTIFKPEANITIAQLVTMGTRAAERPLFVPPDSFQSAWGKFDNTHSVIARVAQYNGLLRDFAPGGPKALSPSAKATRAQAAALLFNVMGTDMSGLNGRFLGDSSDLVRYFRDQTGGNDGKFSVPLETLAKYYVVYGKRYGIRADMAWAMMIHETGYGQYGGDVAPEQNNMAGIGATGGVVPGNSFASAELGVVAQYAHLAWYLYPDHVSHEACEMVQQPADGPITVPGDPRHFLTDGAAHRNNVRTVYELSGKWAVGSSYGTALRNIANEIQVTCGLW